GGPAARPRLHGQGDARPARRGRRRTLARSLAVLAHRRRLRPVRPRAGARRRMRFAVLANTRARWFRDDAKNLEALYRVTSGRGLALTPSTPEEMEQELAALLDDRPEFLAVAGGDGTL